MKTSQYLLGLIAEYQNIYKTEDAQVSAVLLQQLGDDEDIFNRKNFTGHITSSGLVLNQTLDKILLINHRFLKMWLQPGGHVEGGAELYKEAAREIAEETALQAFELHNWHQNNRLLDVPFSIDSHAIPASVQKNEAAHMHHDFTYLFIGDSAQKLTKQIEEVSGAEWFELTEVKNLDTDIDKFIVKIQKFIL